ncbi:MAG: pseudouridine synthase [Clostridia bacterium]
MRLQKYMAACGVASRRKAEEIILSGSVMVNGKKIIELGTQVDEKKDEVRVQGKLLQLEGQKVYIMLNKPKGYVTTVTDPQGRPTIMELLPKMQERVYPIGRLDFATSGLILLTNDGDFTNHMMHPRFQIEKVYVALVTGVPTEEKLVKLRTGLMIEEQMTAPAKVRILEKTANRSKIEIIIHEGRKRQIRRMIKAIGHEIVELERVQIGPLVLQNLPAGGFRSLSQAELIAIRKLFR